MRQQRVDNDSEIRMSMRDVRDRQTYIQREREGERERERMGGENMRRGLTHNFMRGVDGCGAP